jgi:hypothetical protein
MALVVLLFAIADRSRADGILTNDFAALTEAGACKDVCPANIIHSFGDVSYGAPDTDNGFDSAESVNSQGHFGLYARGSANTTSKVGHGGGWAYGNFLISVLVPPQQGHSAGDPGELTLPYHLDGTVTIDWGEVFVDGFLVSGATARLLWGYSAFDTSGNTLARENLANDTWSGNHVSDTVNTDINVVIPFQFGDIFYLSESYYVTVDGHSAAPPAVGFVEADFLHTALLGPAIVEDGLGNALVNPIITSDTGFDFGNPQGGGAAAPEPRGVVVLTVALAFLFGAARRFGSTCSTFKS